MNFILPLSTEFPYVEWPSSPVGWLLLAAWGAGILYLLWSGRRWNAPVRHRLRVVGILAAGAVLGACMLGFRLPALGGLPFPGRPVSPRGPVLMLFAAVPWFLAAGLFGPLSAATLAAISGGIIGLWDRHTLFFPMEMAAMGAMLGFFLRQNYRTRFYRLLRHPMVAALLLTGVYLPAYFFDTLTLSDADLVTRMDYVVSNLPAALLGVGGMLLVAGVVAETVASLKVRGWGARAPWQPSPAERSLGLRFFYWLGLLVAFLVTLLIAGNWAVAERSARNALEERMRGVVDIATERIPFFLETGQSLLLEWGQDSRLHAGDPTAARATLENDIRSVPFFTDLILLDSSGNTVAAFPAPTYDRASAPLDEALAIDLALQGVAIQSYAIPPERGETAARVSFVAALFAPDESVDGVLIGRTNLQANPFVRPVFSAFDDISSLGGEAFLLDENGMVLYRTTHTSLMMPYPLELQGGGAIQEMVAPDGTRRLVLDGRARGRPWTVAVWVPLQRTQELALQIAAPLLLMLFMFSAAMALTLRVVLRQFTASLRTLGKEANYIATGNLERSLQVDAVDEIGELRLAFEEMRRSLKARMDELNRLLKASQGVASTLNVEEAMRPVLQAALEMGASAARVVLKPSLLPDWDSEITALPTSFGLGDSSKEYTYLDYQIMELARRQSQIVLSSPGRLSILKFPPEARVPGALLAVALHYEKLYYGVLWVAYDEGHVFSQEEVHFFATLAGQAALAASNARLFLHSEVGRQRLAAILDSTPDPVLVTDHRNRLLLANPVARRVLALSDEIFSGVPIDQFLQPPDLVALLHSSVEERQSAEVALPDGRVYLAIASPIAMQSRRLGRVCVLRDITHFKELDALKSEFVSTVSHDLRSPLTLIRGYTTMLAMVGDLNEQQTTYVRKITKGIESMSRLVNNLLDLGRIEAGVGLLIEKVPLQDVVDNVVEGLQLRAEHKRITLRTRLPQGGLPAIEADRALLQQALHNLVENAIKYTEPEGWVEVRVEIRENNVLMAVADNGIGIAPVDQARLFERFYRVARRGHIQERGTGLGLAIVKSIAERHGGRVWVESKLGQG
ncbi:MAG: HAMP domain-containing protein, partial [Anaerolineae bacterium]